MLRMLLPAVFVVVLSFNAMANDVRIKGEVKIQAYNSTTALITFPLTWEHSWRESENWDAVWIFVKYRRVGENEPWHHAYLNARGHKVAGRADIPPMEFLPVYTKDYWPLKYDVLRLGSLIKEPTTGETRDVVPGLFLFRKKAGVGNIDIPRVSLEWNFKEGDLSLYHDVTLDDIRNGKIELSVQAIEMVYVPVGPYYLGDRTSPYSFVNERVDAGMLVTSEDGRKFYTMGEIAGSVSEKSLAVPTAYPKGYCGFYTMKYEVSQEQYVNFLNRLTLRDQKKRIGRDLATLQPGQYAFGADLNKVEPSYRNGIVLIEKSVVADTPAVFGFNLGEMTPHNFPDDGKSVACNFLTPEDLIAYMDWAGLRPHSEMEYEKGCRERNPQSYYADRSFAWGTPNSSPLAWSDVSNMGKENEQVGNNKNVNGGGPSSVVYASPVRCGAFATELANMAAAGASKWGIMEMTGNLAEIYYNAEGGRNFRGDVFGDGNVWSTVTTWNEDSTLRLELALGMDNYAPNDSLDFYREIDYPTVSKLGNKMRAVLYHRAAFKDCRFERKVYDDLGHLLKIVYSTPLRVPFPNLEWPDTMTAWGFRGGSCNDDNRDVMAVSYRGTASAFAQSDVDVRYKYAGFRGGRSVPIRTIQAGTVAAENGLKRDTAVVCQGDQYTIKEVVQGDDDALSTLYFWEINDGSGWKEIAGKQDKDLLLDWTVNDSVPYKEYRFRRHGVASHAEAYSNEVTLCIPGYSVSGKQGLAIGMFDNNVNMFVELGAVGDVQLWKLDYSSNRMSYEPGRNNVTGRQQFDLRRDRLDPPVAVNQNGVVDLVVEVSMGGCSFETNRELVMDQYANVTPAVPIVDARDGKTYTTAGLPDLIWMTTDLLYDVPANSVGGYTWPASSGGNYTLRHLLANAAGKLQLCPDGFEVPDFSTWDYVLFMYGDGFLDSYGQPCYDQTSSSLYDPALSNFINTFFEGETLGSAGHISDTRKWWTGEGSAAYSFGDMGFGFFFGLENINTSDMDTPYRVRCVKIR